MDIVKHSSGSGALPVAGAAAAPAMSTMKGGRRSTRRSRSQRKSKSQCRSKSQRKSRRQH